jgi:hypothetical protein
METLTTKTARFVDASPPERGGIVVVHLGDGCTIRATAALVAELVAQPLARRYVAYDVDAAGNRYNPRSSSVDVPPSIVARLVIDDVQLARADAERDADAYMRAGLFVRTWREVSALRTANHWHVQALDATIDRVAQSDIKRRPGHSHVCDRCGRPCVCPGYTPADGCMTCGRDDCERVGLERHGRTP